MSATTSRGLGILARSLSIATKGAGKGFEHGNQWQYHPRSDRHSKIACWAILFDLLLRGGALARHVKAGKVTFGINHTMRDYQHNRDKDLDLVICRSGQTVKKGGVTEFADMVAAYKVDLTVGEVASLASLPSIPLTDVKTALIALEAKAAMTEFGKARPRLYDELNSSHLTIHGDTDQAIAAGFAMVNTAQTFVSPLRNPWPIGVYPTRLNNHDQPKDAALTVRKLEQLPRRAAAGQPGFDAIAVVAVECANDGTPVRVIDGPPGPSPGDMLHYENFLERIETIYAHRFGGI